MTGTMPLVRRLGADDARAVARVLGEAFAAYPVMRFVLGPGNHYPDRLDRLIEYFVTARVLRDEPLLGVFRGGGLQAAAIVAFPGVIESPPEMAELRERLWGELGAGARARYESLGETWARLAVDVPNVHLSMIGVLEVARGQGLARALIEDVQRISREATWSRGVTLTTEDPANVAFYERMGYEVVGHVRVRSGFQTWSFFRPD